MLLQTWVCFPSNEFYPPSGFRSPCLKSPSWFPPFIYTLITFNFAPDWSSYLNVTAVHKNAFVQNNLFLRLSFLSSCTAVAFSFPLISILSKVSQAFSFGFEKIVLFKIITKLENNTPFLHCCVGKREDTLVLHTLGKEVRAEHLTLF